MDIEKECRKCKITKSLTEFRICTERRKDRCVTGDGKYPCSWCRQCERDRSLARYHANKEEFQQQNKEYKRNNRDKVNETRRAYMKEKMKDHVERLKRDLKCLITAKIKKTKHTTEYLGTEVSLIVKWLEWNFTEDMTWDNHGTVWEIDHTLAINTFNLSNEEECFLCFNWKNLMPMYKLRNSTKGDLVIPFCVFFHEQRLRKFFQLQQINEDLEHYLKMYSNHFIDSKNKQCATRPNCGKLLRALTTTYHLKD